MTAKNPPRDELVNVYRAGDEMEARMVQELLQNAGIESMVNARVAPGLFPSTLGDLARHDILVFTTRADHARKVISEQYPVDEGA